MLQLLIALAILKSATCDTLYIIPNTGDASSCPASAGRCYTLQEYASNPTFASNLTLELQPGNHSLNTTLSLTTSVVNFTMVSINGVIVCSRSPTRGSITFEGVQNVRIVGQQNFVDCYTRVRTANNLTVEGSMYQGGDSVGFQVSDVSYAHFQRTSFISVRGSAMAITGSTINVEDCAFIGNGHPLRHGGAIVTTQSRTLTVINSKFIGNSAGVEGGGIYSMSSRVDISGCNFTHNVAGQLGGAVSIQESGGSIQYSNFIENTAGDISSGGGTGGAVHNQAVFDSTALEIHHSSFVNNAAGGNGGAVFIRTRRHFDVTNSIFQNNSAYRGGAIDLYKNHHVIILSVINCTFNENSAVLKRIYSNPSPRGGAVQIRGGIRCVGSNFTNNSAMYYGGVAYMYDDSNSFYTEQCIFTNNSARDGSGGVLYGAGRETATLIVDSIFTHNSAPLCGVADMLSITDSYHNNLTVISSIFVHNSATDNTSDVGGLGGVGCVKSGSITVTCSTFTDNRAAHNAGVFYANESTLTISQSLFSRNFVVNNGGVMYTNQSSHSISDTVFNSNSAENSGGTLFIGTNGQGTVHNCQFRQNSAGEGGTLFIDSSALTVTQTNFLSNAASTASGVASSCNSQVTIDGSAYLQTTTVSACTLFSGDISSFNVLITFDCPFGEPDDPSVITPPEDISLPITYDIVSIRQDEHEGSEGACPIQQLQQEALESLRNDIEEIIQNSVTPFLQSNEPRNR